MSQSIRDFNLLNRPADVAVTTPYLVARGELVALDELDVHVFYGQDEFDPAPVNMASHALYARLCDFATAIAGDGEAGEAKASFAGGLMALLRFLLDTAKDVAEDDEPPSGLHTTAWFPQLRRQCDCDRPEMGCRNRHHLARPIWLQRNDVGGWTAMFPEDY